jgi:hypothetical protein
MEIRLAMLLNILQCTWQHLSPITIKNYLSQNVNSAEAEKPWFKYLHLFSHMHILLLQKLLVIKLKNLYDPRPSVMNIPIFPATQEVEIERLQFEASLDKKKLARPYYKKQKQKAGPMWWFMLIIPATWGLEV